MRWVIVAAALFTLVGCKQGVGDRCQVKSDCEDNLDCILPAGGNTQTGGTCQMVTGPSTDMAAPDAGGGQDLSATD
jgi:hypothetical protein